MAKDRLEHRTNESAFDYFSIVLWTEAQAKEVKMVVMWGLMCSHVAHQDPSA